MISPRTSRATSIVVLVLALSGAPFARQTPPAGAPLPVVSAAALLVYTPVAVQARVEGDVRFRVSTDGARVVAAEATRHNPLFERVAFENLRSWRFEPHRPAQFDVAFVFRLDPSPCGATSTEDSSFRAEYPTRVTMCEATRAYRYDSPGTLSRDTRSVDPFEAIYGVRVTLNPPASWCCLDPLESTWRERPKKPRPAKPAPEPPHPMRLREASIVGYPLEARLKDIEGVVRLRVRPDGMITIIEGPSELAEPTLAAVRRWTIDPPSGDADELRFNFVLTDRDCAGGGPVVEGTAHGAIMTITAKPPAACGK